MAVRSREELFPSASAVPASSERVECPDEQAEAPIEHESDGAIAQLEERLNGIQKVRGSNPRSSTTPHRAGGGFGF